MKIEIIGANIKFSPENAAELLQLKDFAAKLEHGSFAHVRKYQWELQSVVVPLQSDAKLGTHERQSMGQAADHIHIHLD